MTLGWHWRKGKTGVASGDESPSRAETSIRLDTIIEPTELHYSKETHVKRR